ncbi:BLUF domain-containing protein [Agarilytica rhodophyticola]|uniref:BLUF domain-containing protein n=1 Tax=Agarilytica rhodophyticola TaxID=1737490 RepID=UPI000CD9B86F|nr:BLUF domain-containing protein [Agarilytica rhodophyticola]
MKCIVYISRVVSKKNGVAVPEGLSDIYMSARKFNARFDITGVLAFKNSFYLQIIEGGNNEVNQLYRNIQADKRHSDIHTLIDMDISQRSFAKKSMRLVTLVQKDKEIERFITKYSSVISKFSNQQLSLLNNFYDLSLPHQEFHKSSYDGKHITLISWPDFNHIEQSPGVIELSARLTSGSHAYDDIVNSGEFGNKNELDGILEQFDTLDILRVSSIVNKQNYSHSSTSDSFYSKMKNFLRLG